MLDIRRLRQDPERIRESVRARGVEPKVVDSAVKLDREHREALTRMQELIQQQKRLTREISLEIGRGHDPCHIREEARQIARRARAFRRTTRQCRASLSAAMLLIPNIPHPSVPGGSKSARGRVVREWGRRGEFAFTPRSHVELARHLGIIDLDRAARIAGPGFSVLLGCGALMERALIRLMLDMHVSEHGYKEVAPPLLCSSEALTSTGQLPRHAEGMYTVAGTGLYLSPKAEVPLTNYYENETIENDLPVRFVAGTTCFRRAAGKSGRASRGILRLHQFSSVELVKFVEPHTSDVELEGLVRDCEDVLQRICIPYRVVLLSPAQLSFAAAKSYRMEVWAPAQERWLPVSTCSNFGDFQARRAGIRYRGEDGQPRFVHTVNGPAAAVPRLMAAIIETGQAQDGTVSLPEALTPYMNGCRKLEHERRPPPTEGRR